MNTVILCGRLTADPKSGTTQSGKTYCNFSLAVNKAYSQDKGADFIDIVAWNATAQNCAKYLTKGSQVLINGSFTTETYEKNGITTKRTKVLANHVEFLSRPNNGSSQPAQQKPSINGLKEIVEADDSMPF